MLNLELCYKEYSALREELNGIKKAQLWLIGFSVTASGILLGVGWRENSALPLAAACFFPLIIIIPFWHIFFDKAATVTRIVGYLRVLEKIIINPDSVKNYIGWENALVLFRDLQETEVAKAATYKNSFKQKLKPLTYLTSARYWCLSYLIFFSLSLLCILLSIFYFFNQANYQPLFLKITIVSFIALVTYSSCWNFGLLCQLLFGRYSYNVNGFLWRNIMLKVRIFDRQQLKERLKEYGDNLWRAKAFDLTGEEGDFSDYETLVIRATTREAGKVNVEVQLLDNLSSEIVNSNTGLYKGKHLLFQEPRVTEIKIPLSKFEGVDFKQIKRLVIHCGKEAYGVKINPVNLKINIEEIALE